MPELPEVETIVRDLRGGLIGARFLDISGNHNSAVAQALDNASWIRDAVVLSVERRGKFIVINFERDFVMTIHLRMSGRLLMRDYSEESLPYERTRIDFDRCSLRFCDVRKFGRVWINSLDEYEQATGIARLGIEPFDESFDAKHFTKLLKGKRGHIKKWLLDQSLIAGIGNIYADEACFYAGIRPNAEASKLSGAQLDALHGAVLKALNQGIRNRGTSISDFADAYGKTGRNQELLYVYGRGGQKCLRCKAEALVKTRVAGRGTVYCESCQS